MSSALYIFTKLFKPLEKHWRIQGTCIAIFLDDGWATVEGKESCLVKAQCERQDFYCAGFLINEEKAVWEPSQILDCLGITWNFVFGTLKIVDRRITKITNTIDHIIEADFRISAQELASFTSQMISTALVVGKFRKDYDQTLCHVYLVCR